MDQLSVVGAYVTYPNARICSSVTIGTESQTKNNAPSECLEGVWQGSNITTH